jgi:signal transduction histidine kinase
MTEKAAKAKSASSSALHSAELIARISQVFASSKSLETTLNAMVQLLRSALGLERCSVMLLDRENGVLRLAAAAGIPEQFWPDIQIPVGEGISGRVVYERKPVLVSDITKSEFAHAAHHERYSTHSFISVPIIARGNVVGVLNANSRSDQKPLGRQDLDLFVCIASFAGLAIENVKLENQNETLSKWMEATLDALGCAVVIVDKNVKIRYLNTLARKWLSVPAETSPVQRPLLDLWPQLDGTNTLGRIREALAGKKSSVVAEILTFPRNVSAEHEVYIAPMKLELPFEERFAVLAAHDISSSARLDAYKSDFLALLSHELRTPITAIQAASQLLLGLDAQKNCSDWEQMLRTVSSNTRRLLSVVNSLIDLHDLEREALQLVPHQADIDLLIDDVVRMLDQDIKKKHLTVHKELEPVEAWVDPSRLSQAVACLLDNAVKFLPPGGEVRIHLRRVNDKTFAIEIHDNGPGIPSDVLARLTHRFQQGENVITRSSGGLGIGLYLATQLVELHNGRLELRSEPGEGTTALIVLPIEKGPEFPEG